MLPSDRDYELHHGDCIPFMAGLPDHSFDMSVFSPPFPSVFSYTSAPEDLGNCEDLRGEAKIHLSFFYRQLARVLKPGRIAMVHVAQIPALKRNGEVDTFDYRGLNIRLARRAGLLYQYDWLVAKNPQAQAIRTHSHKLLFVTMDRDRAISCGANPDYLIKFIARGENAVPIDSPDITRNDWIKWAEAAWDWRDIRETDTLNVKAGRGEEDTKHICPLQLGVINRLVRLYSNPGEIVFSPFAGIGSEGYEALKLGRRFVGCEIKPEYHAAAIQNLDRAIWLRNKDTQPLFASMDAERD